MCNAVEVILSLGNGSVNVMQLFPADAFFLRTNRTIFFYAFVKPGSYSVWFETIRTKMQSRINLASFQSPFRYG